MPPRPSDYPFSNFNLFKENLNFPKRIRIQGEIKYEHIQYRYSYKDATGITGQTMLR
jgi:hypothetical protein